MSKCYTCRHGKDKHVSRNMASSYANICWECFSMYDEYYREPNWKEKVEVAYHPYIGNLEYIEDIYNKKVLTNRLK